MANLFLCNAGSGGGISGYTITYNVDGTEYTEHYSAGDDILHPTSFTPTKSNYTFYGWNTSSASEERLNSRTAFQDETLYAKFIVTSVTFQYTGAEQTFSAKTGVTYNLEVGGGCASQWAAHPRGYGALATGDYTCTSSETLYVYCGGVGARGGSSSPAEGYNGGGIGYYICGGGATHIAKNQGTLPIRGSSTTDITNGNILIIAGGGASVGDTGQYASYGYGKYTYQAGNGTFMGYSDSTNASAYGGGGGYFAGTATSSYAVGGGGYIDNVDNGSGVAGGNTGSIGGGTGYGYAIITVVSV